MSSPYMTRMLGFFGWACAALPGRTVRTVTRESASAAVLPSIVARMVLRSARLHRARRPGREPGGGHGRPLLHGVLRVAPLPLRRRLDVPASHSLVDPHAEELAGHGVGHL